MDETIVPTQDELELQKHLGYAGCPVPIDVICGWAENEKTWARIYADSYNVNRYFGLAVMPALPACLRPYLRK